MIQIHQFRYSNKQTSERENHSDELKCLIEFIRTENGLKHKEIGTMYSKNNNSSIHQTGTCISFCLYANVTPTDELMNCGISNPVHISCWDCRYYYPRVDLDRDKNPEDEAQPGDCRRYPPVTDHGLRDTQANWAEFPMVMACDWCGEFASRLSAHAINGGNPARCNEDGSGGDDGFSNRHGAAQAER